MAGLPAEKHEPRFTWADYCTWQDEARWELFDGQAVAMAPAPSLQHQSVVTNLGAALRQHFRRKPCRALVSPVDVRLSEDNVVQPDIVVVCNPRQLKAYVDGAPALVVEVQSPQSLRHDRVRKLNLYARFGVREYWLVTPYPPMLEVLSLAGNGRYAVEAVYSEADTLVSPSFPELRIPLADIFDFPIPEDQRIDELRDLQPPYPPRRAAPAQAANP